MWHILNEIYLKYTVYTVYVCKCVCVYHLKRSIFMEVFRLEKKYSKPEGKGWNIMKYYFYKIYNPNSGNAGTFS